MKKTLVTIFSLSIFGFAKSENIKLLYPIKQFHKIGDDYFYAKGTFIIDNKEISPLSQATAIECYRYLKKCIFANSSIYMGVIDVEIELFNIKNWDSEKIITENYNYKCMLYSYNIDFKKQKITGYISEKIDLDLNDKKICNNFKEKKLILEDGNEWNIKNNKK